jgi:hypothetical protein
MAGYLTLDEVRALVLQNWGAIEATGRQHVYTFRPHDPSEALLQSVRVDGWFNPQSDRICRRHLTLRYTVTPTSKEVTTYLYQDMPEVIFSALSRCVTRADFDSMEFTREELMGKSAPRIRTYYVDVETTLRASRVIEVRAPSGRDARDKALADPCATSEYGWHIEEVIQPVEITRTRVLEDEKATMAE